VILWTNFAKLGASAVELMGMVRTCCAGCRSSYLPNKTISFLPQARKIRQSNLSGVSKVCTKSCHLPETSTPLRRCASLPSRERRRPSGGSRRGWRRSNGGTAAARATAGTTRPSTGCAACRRGGGRRPSEFLYPTLTIAIGWTFDF
jgi:hypothetical protein